jgi:hypothetical protein
MLMFGPFAMMISDDEVQRLRDQLQMSIDLGKNEGGSDGMEIRKAAK